MLDPKPQRNRLLPELVIVALMGIEIVLPVFPLLVLYFEPPHRVRLAQGKVAAVKADGLRISKSAGKLSKELW